MRGTIQGLRRYHLLAVLVLAIAGSGCASRGLPDTLEPDVARAAVAATAPDRPLRVIFDWRLLEGDARFNGSGATRMEPPYRARLDLFGPRGDGYLSAALVDHEIRVPGGTAGVPIPPPALMWAVLGVVAPPPEAELVATRVEEDRTELFYAVGEGRLRYGLVDGRLRSARWEDRRRLDVELTAPGPEGVPGEAVYRDWAGYVELRLTTDRVDDVDEYPPETWTPGA